MDEIVGFKPKTYVLPIDICEPYKGVLDMDTGILYTEKVNPKMTVEELIGLTEIKELPDTNALCPDYKKAGDKE